MQLASAFVFAWSPHFVFCETGSAFSLERFSVVVLNTTVPLCGNYAAEVGSCVTCRLECKLSEYPGAVVSSPPDDDVCVEVILLKGLSASPTERAEFEVLSFQLIVVESGC